MTETILVDRESCWGCPVYCKRVVEVDEPGLEVGREYGGPEFETIGGFGSAAGISDLKLVAKANQICDANGLDTISASMMIAGAMEAAEAGLIPERYLEGQDLRFGSAEGSLALLRQMVSREGLGDILAEGPQAAVDQFGPEIGDYFLHVKGQPVPLHEPRYKVGLGLGYALSPTGADHNHNMHDPLYEDADSPSFEEARMLGISEGVSTFELSPAKARLFKVIMLQQSLKNSLDLCVFFPYNLPRMVEQVTAVTGWDVTTWELMQAAERALTMTRVFNVAAGLSPADDTLPARFFEPLQSGALEGVSLDRQEFYETRDLVYEMLGWDPQSGAPSRAKLYELGLDWLVEGR